ncbi:hypothetical protein PTTG_08458 [Puccinia triticina 1-1 BBBD Race 1]|uniref:C2H2-type domain-containing protein n=2 Tax=Puccinia triticina TaxID=208348 RepID=A0A0C4F5Q7_PUCT1|nr:uncharacterized protein PtA15_15A31 [Puccinia triticina]OAV88261.1 hypothetical protein PTTG_08458 [Puccinia triticina 1-1 BBBD Race 1]WAQ91642.1 hypothetical protein PtA15_15A31 [Puccinia triticina]WAR62441.1 hypothetical protein PtB15_15B25 [Puccinia triticina]
MSAFQPTPDQDVNLVCHWTKPDCLQSFLSAEELFNHLCDSHVGRKRNGNLSLSCSWEGCTHKAAKRDHMTSHMMVHCPLQTNICGICDKTFKRSYDLRKHEVTHTAAHHELHTRSRAVVYQEREIPYASEISAAAMMNRMRVNSLPRDQSGNWTGSNNVLTAAPGPVHRERSFSVPRHNPYQRPQSEQTYPLYPTAWNNEFKFPSDRHQRADSIAEDGPYNVNMPGFNQFQFLEQYPQLSDPPAPDLFSASSVPPSTSSGSSSSSHQPTTNYVASSGNWSEIFSFVADSRRESQPHSIPSSDDFSGSDGLSGVFAGDQPREILRTSSLPLYPTAPSSFNSFENLGYRHSVSAPAGPEEPTVIPDFQLGDFFPPEQPYEQPYLESSATPFQASHDAFGHVQNYDCIADLHTLLSLADLSGFSQTPAVQTEPLLLNLPPFQFTSAQPLF